MLNTLNTTSQDRGVVKCLYQTNGTLLLLITANKDYLLTNDGLIINGIAMK